jgi:hypothetical protein
MPIRYANLFLDSGRVIRTPVRQLADKSPSYKNYVKRKSLHYISKGFPIGSGKTFDSEP